METADFIERLRSSVQALKPAVSDKCGNWAVKGFIDIYKHIYTISTDTKVISKILELYLFPQLFQFAQDNRLDIELPNAQNVYPDVTFKDDKGNLYAVDIKTSYRVTDELINGMTLGSFTGYFRNRSDSKNVVHPYGDYRVHLVLGIIYSRIEHVDERRTYCLDDLERIESVANEFEFFVQEKWKMASDVPGSGNTKNIGSVKSVNALIKGEGVFSSLGEAYFDDYWMHYLTNDMAKAAELPSPYYHDLTTYKDFKHIQ